jgi:hypothetical protein
MTQPTRGAALLEALINPKVHTQASVARAVDATPEAVRHWLLRRSRPSAERRQKLEALGIPASAWDELVNDATGDGKAA